MRRLSLVGVLLAAGVFVAPWARGLALHETFSGYPAGPTGDWYYLVNEGTTGAGGVIADWTPGDQAVYFQIPESVLTGAEVNTVYIETSNLAPAISSPDFLTGFGAYADVVTDGVIDRAAVGNMYYYVTFETTGDADIDSYYVTSSPIDPIASTEWEYRESRSMTGGDSWDYYEWNGSGWDVTSGATIDPLLFPDAYSLGMQFDINLDDYAFTSGDPITIWVDNVAVPEPGALLLGCLGAIGILARRPRRQTA